MSTKERAIWQARAGVIWNIAMLIASRNHLPKMRAVAIASALLGGN
jgi:hypothetical protein